MSNSEQYWQKSHAQIEPDPSFAVRIGMSKGLLCDGFFLLPSYSRFFGNYRLVSFISYTVG